MSKLNDLGQDISRLSEIARIMSKHGFAPNMRKMLWPLKKSDRHLKSEHSAAERFTLMLEELGPTFIKIGQLLSTRSDLLPADFIHALSRLQDNAPPFAFADAKKQIESSLKKPLSELFAFFDENPLACASMAQVHAARLHDGSEVVVKILRPGIKQQIERDSSMLLMCAQLLEWLIEEACEYQAVDLAAEFLKCLSTEMNFHTEAHNLQLFLKYNKHRKQVKVPNFYPEFSSAEVLTMERIYGKRISDLKNDDQKNNERLIEYLLEVAFEHVFIDGLFHADPHPGNVLITPDNQIAFIDFGLIGHVARDHQDRLLSILLALALKDPDTLSRQLIYLGQPSCRVPLHQFRDGLRRLLDRYAGLSLSSMQAGCIMADIMELSLQYKIHLPREFALLTKASLALEGIIRQLHPHMNVSKQLAKKAESLLVERLDPRNFRAAGAKTALQLATLAQDLPTQINQTLVDLERGEIQISILSKDLAQLDRTLRGMALAVFSSLMATALIAGGFYMLQQNNGKLGGAPFFAFTCAFILFLSITIWSLIGGSLPKVSLHRWAKKNKHWGSRF